MSNQPHTVQRITVFLIWVLFFNIMPASSSAAGHSADVKEIGEASTTLKEVKHPFAEPPASCLKTIAQHLRDAEFIAATIEKDYANGLLDEKSFRRSAEQLIELVYGRKKWIFAFEVLFDENPKAFEDDSLNNEENVTIFDFQIGYPFKPSSLRSPHPKFSGDERGLNRQISKEFGEELKKAATYRTTFEKFAKVLHKVGQEKRFCELYAKVDLVWQQPRPYQALISDAHKLGLEIPTTEQVDRAAFHLTQKLKDRPFEHVVDDWVTAAAEAPFETDIKRLDIDLNTMLKNGGELHKAQIEKINLSNVSTLLKRPRSFFESLIENRKGNISAVMDYLDEANLSVGRPKLDSAIREEWLKLALPLLTEHHRGFDEHSGWYRDRMHMVLDLAIKFIPEEINAEKIEKRLSEAEANLKRLEAEYLQTASQRDALIKQKAEAYAKPNTSGPSIEKELESLSERARKFSATRDPISELVRRIYPASKLTFN